jgi:hypothetical protein
MKPLEELILKKKKNSLTRKCGAYYDKMKKSRKIKENPCVVGKVTFGSLLCLGFIPSFFHTLSFNHFICVNLRILVCVKLEKNVVIV